MDFASPSSESFLNRTTTSSLSLIRYTPDRPNSSLIFEHDSEKQGLASKIVVLKTLPDKLKNFFLVPKWAIVVTSFFYLMLTTILLAAVIILLCGRRPGVYLEDCKQRSCAPGLNLKCINNVCRCTDSQYFLNKCIDLKGNSDFCQSPSQCQNGLNCTAGKCQCDDSSYWNGKKCLARKSYRETCSANQCLTDTFLFCDNKTQMCMCPSDR